MFKTRLSEKVNFRLTKKDFESIRQIASARNLSVHQLTRALLLETYKSHNNKDYSRNKFG